MSPATGRERIRPLCFVVMPFGTKSDPSGATVRFDDVYAKVIQPAVEAAGMQPIRADGERVGGFIHKPMFERLLLCEYAVADLTTANGNVYYELGIRHAIRPLSTILIQAKGFRAPFDVDPLRTLRYELTGTGRPKQAAGYARKLTDSLLHAKRQREEDSPLFQLLADMPRPDLTRLSGTDFGEHTRLVNDYRLRLEVAQREDKAAVDAIRSELGDPADLDRDLLIALMVAQAAVNDHPSMVDLAARMPGDLARLPFVQEQLAFALNRLGRGQEAEAVLTRLIDTQGGTGETYGLLGRIYKDRWLAERTADSQVRAGTMHRAALDAYMTGFRTDPHDYYPGFNAVELMWLADPDDPRLPEWTAAVRFQARRQVEKGQHDYWAQTTLAALAMIADDADGAVRALEQAMLGRPLGWQADTTADTVGRIIESRRAAGDVPRWLTDCYQLLREAGSGRAGGSR